MEVSIDNLEDIEELTALTECGKVEFKETTGQLDRGMETLCASKAHRPFCYKGRPYYRVESMTSTMPQTMYNQLLIIRDEAKSRWELQGNARLTLNDMDDNEILKTVRLGIEAGRLPENTGNNVSVILEKFGLLVDGVFNNAAAVLFANRELIEYPQCLLRLACFKGTDKMVFMDNQRVQGNLFRLLDAAMAFIFKHLSLSGTTESLERQEYLTIPYKAVREGVINSLCHRQFRTPGSSVGIAIYDDRMEIENPGVFPNDWDIDKMKSEHCSIPRNPLIANVLYKRKLLENWGRGIDLMMEECKKANLPEPEYKMSGGFVTLVFRYGENNRISTAQVPYKHHISTTQVQSLINIVVYDTYSVKEMMDLLDLKSRSYFSKEYLKPAVEAGILEPIYPDQLRSPKQKYRLTEKGKALLTPKS